MTERFWWIALTVASASATAHLVTMLGTRWGNRGASIKAFLFSLLIHASFVCGLFAARPELERFAAAPQPNDPRADESAALQATLSEIDPRSASNRERPIWERPVDRAGAVVSRAERSPIVPGTPEERRSVERTVKNRRDVPDVVGSLADEDPTPASVDLPEASRAAQAAPSLTAVEETTEARAADHPAFTRSERRSVQEAASVERSVASATTVRPVPQLDRMDDLRSQPPSLKPAEPSSTRNEPATVPAATAPAGPPQPALSDEIASERQGDGGLGARFGTRPTRTRDFSGDPLAGDRVRIERGRLRESARDLGSRESLGAALPGGRSETPLTRQADLLHGTVTDAASGRPLAAAVVRIDRIEGEPLTAVTGNDGTYQLVLDAMPETFAVTAARDGYRNGAQSLRGDVVNSSTRVDFALRPEERGIIPIETRPVVHHLGNDKFEGAVNARFQRASEGDVFSARFDVSAQQLREFRGQAMIWLMAKGMQCPPEFRINGKLVGEVPEKSPEDGSFAPLELPFDSAMLTRGGNRLEIRPTSCTGDLDDFEFINVEIQLSR